MSLKNLYKKILLSILYTEWDYGKRTDSFIKDYIKVNYHLEKQIDTAMIYRKGGE